MEKNGMERGKRMARKFRVIVNGKEYVVEVEEIKESKKTKEALSEAFSPPKVEVSREETLERKDEGGSEGSKVVKAPMAGIIVKILVREGQKVEKGEKLLIFEAMKMENELLSEFSGTVKEIKVREGENVETGQVLMVIE